MTTQRPITLPARTPSTWELRLPGYPVLTNSWQSSAFPELLGTLPNGAEWSLTFESQTDDEALALLLPWRASGCGLWPLTILPIELAGGVNDVGFRKRLTGTTWTMAREPRMEPVKKGRYNVTIELVHELTFDSVYGPGAPTLPQTRNNPLRLNVSTTLVIAGLPTAFVDVVGIGTATEVLLLNLVDDLEPISQPSSWQDLQSSWPAGPVLALGLADSLVVAAVKP